MNTPPFIKNYNEVYDESVQQSPDWVKQIRSEHARLIQEVGFPTVKDEEWKYTSMSPVLNSTFEISQPNNKVNLDNIKDLLSPDDINIVTVNGELNTSLSNIQNLEKGTTLSSLSDEWENDRIRKLLQQFDGYTKSAFASVNATLQQHGLCLTVDKKVTSERLIHIVHLTTAEENNTLSLPRLLIVCDEQSEISICESHLSQPSKQSYLTIPLTEIYLAESAVLHYCKSQNDGPNAFHVGQTRVWQEQNSNFDSFSFMMGAKLTRNNLDIVLAGEGGNANLNALYTCADQQHVDNHTSVQHRVPNCTSNQLYKGILFDSARAVFNGKIFVDAIAQQTNSYQLNNNILLGKDCRVDTKPQLEIFADDVKCTHGATIGQLDEDEIFYLQTRNISKSKAIEMISRGFAQDALDHLSHPSIENKLHTLLEPIFASH